MLKYKKFAQFIVLFTLERLLLECMFEWYWNRGFAGRPLELKWLPFYRFSWDFLAFPPFWGSTVSTFYCKNHHHYSDLIANQVCYAFWHVLSHFHNENELTKRIRLVSGCHSIFTYKRPYFLTSKIADFLLLTWLRTNYCVTRKTSIIILYALLGYDCSYHYQICIICLNSAVSFISQTSWYSSPPPITLQ